MAFIYEVNGVKVQFDHEPTDADIDEAARGLGAKPESNMPKPVEGAGGAAFGVYRPAGRRPESQNDREAAKDMPVQTVRGIVSNIPAIAGIPGSIVNAAANLPRTAQNISNRYQIAREAFTGEAPQTQPLPEYNQITPYDMNYFASLTPGPQPSSPAGQLAFGAGQMVGAPIVPPVLKAAGPILKEGASIAKDAASLAAHPIKTARTGTEAFLRGYRNPESLGTQNSALMPIRDTYFPHEQVAEYQAGSRGPLQMTEQPTSNLIQTPTQRWAQSMAPVNEQGQSLVAPKGKGFEGYMENLGAGYKQNPTQQIIDAITGVGGMALTGMPTPATAMAKAVPAFAARTLQQATQFEPNFNAAAIHAAQGQAGLQANIPTTQALPAPGPVAPQTIPMPGPQRVVNIEGQRSVLPHQIDTTNSQAQTPKQVSMQVAASKIKPVEPTPVQPASPAPTVQPETLAPQPGSSKPTTDKTLKTNFTMSGNIPKLIPNGRLAGEIHRELDPLHRQLQQLSDEMKYASPTEAEVLRNQYDELYSKIKPLEGELTKALQYERDKGRGKIKREQFESLTKPMIQNNTDLGKLSEQFDLTHSHESREFLYGKKGNKDIAIHVATKDSPNYQVYDITGDTPKLIAEFDTAGKQIPSKKGPSNVSQMLTEEQGKMWNSLKAAENPLEQKVAGMTQAHRDIIEKEMRKNMKPGDTEAQHMLNIFEKYRIKK